eukprot:m.231560 g.231560  ORF g.231560 m.231560 type:complete len:1168 (+) comp33603_c2_seq1:217-3720(+)
MSKVQVAVRVRPFNSREKKNSSHNVITMKGPTTEITNPANGANHTFHFDHSFWTFDDKDSNFVGQEQVFESVGVGVIDNSFEGYNSCIFAYGQTGSGKTYTMMGMDSDPGVIPRLCTSLYDRIHQNEDPNMSFKVEVSYMEIYNEKVKDLLSVGGKKQNLRVREHKIMGPYVEGLTKLAVTGYEAIATLMNEGNKIRHTAATAMNNQSSRSHAVFTLIFTQAMYDPATKSSGEKVSRISLVDLAGSERQAKTQASGARLQEGSNINKSLTTLGQVISSLAEAAGKKGAFVPYRNSTLTWLLKDNLGGNSKTVMLAALSPASDNYDETMSTLRYADRAKQIVNNAIVNEDPNQRLIRELREELERLRNSVGSEGATGNSDEAILLRQQLAETQGMIAEMTQSWEEKVKASENVIAQHRKLLSDHGAQVTGDQGALKLKSKLPHFVSISNEFDFDITIYSLHEGLTRVGTSDAEVRQEITIEGPGVDDEHCIIEHRAEFDEEADRLLEVVKLHPIAEACFVNGKQVEETVRLRQGMVVQFGKNVFRFNHPTEAQRMKQLKAQGLLDNPNQEEEAISPELVPGMLPTQAFEEMKKREAERIKLEKEELEADRRQVEEERQNFAAEQQKHSVALTAQMESERAERDKMAAEILEMRAMMVREKEKAAQLQLEKDAEREALVLQQAKVAAEAEKERMLRLENQRLLDEETKKREAMMQQAEEERSRSKQLQKTQEKAQREAAEKSILNKEEEMKRQIADIEKEVHAKRKREEERYAALLEKNKSLGKEAEEQHRKYMLAENEKKKTELERQAKERAEKIATAKNTARLEGLAKAQKDKDTEEQLREQARQKARAALKSKADLDARQSRPAKVSLDGDKLVNLDFTTPTVANNQFTTKTTVKQPIGAMGSIPPSKSKSPQSNNPFAMPARTASLSSNPFSIITPSVPTRSTKPGQYRQGGHPQAIAPTVALPPRLSGIATDYFGSLGATPSPKDTARIPSPSTSTTPFDNPPQLPSSSNPKPTTLEYNDPYKRISTPSSAVQSVSHSRNASSDMNDIDPLAWNPKRRSPQSSTSNVGGFLTSETDDNDVDDAEELANRAHRMSMTSPPTNLTSPQPGPGLEERRKQEGIQKMMMAQKNFLEEKAKAAAADKALQERWAQENASKKTWFGRGKK